VSFRIKQRDNWGDWFASVTISSKDYGGDLEAAEKAAEAADKKLLELKEKGLRAAAGDGTAEGSPVSPTDTFAEYTASWKAECRGEVSPGWKISQDQMLRDYVLFKPAEMGTPEEKRKPTKFSKMQIGKIQPRDIGNIMAAALENRSPTTGRLLFATLHKMFDDAVEHFGILHASPVLRRYKPKKVKRERNFLVPADAFKLLDHSKGHWLEPALWIAFFTGMRPSEIQALRWSAVRLDLGVVQIRAAWNEKEGRMMDHPKQEDWGKAPIPLELARYLVAYRKRAKPKASDFVCPGPLGGMMAYRTYHYTIKNLCREAELLEITPHETRHSSTALWQAAGASEGDLQKLLNHAAASTTREYIHSVDSRLGSIGEKVGRPSLFVITGNGEQVPTSALAGAAS
jgi:integrase